jgi:hypothetical protein
MNNEIIELFYKLIIAYPNEFKLGFTEGMNPFGITYDNNPESDRSQAYDLGRSLRQGMYTVL